MFKRILKEEQKWLCELKNDLNKLEKSLNSSIDLLKEEIRELEFKLKRE